MKYNFKRVNEQNLLYEQYYHKKNNLKEIPFCFNFGLDTFCKKKKPVKVLLL